MTKSSLFAAIAIMLCSVAGSGYAQTLTDRLPGVEPYRAGNIAGVVPNLYFSPSWIAGTETFWYQKTDASGANFILVDGATGDQKPAFDHGAMAAALGKALGRKLEPAGLPIWSLVFASDMKSVTVTADGRPFVCDLPTTKCAASSEPDRSSISPDGKHLVYLRDYNLWLRDTTTGHERQVTTDGVENFSYGDIDGNADFLKLVRVRMHLPSPLTNATWSPDGRYVLAMRQDLRSVSEKLLLTDYLPPDGSYDAPFFARASTASDPQRPNTYLTLIDTVTGQSRPMTIDPQSFNDWAAVYLLGGITWWPKDGREVYVITANRGGNHYRLTRLDLESGHASNVIEEAAKFYVRMSPIDYSYPSVYVTSNGKEALWYSERDGWGHLYLYDLPSGKLKRQITKGFWVVDNILRVDEDTRTIYFSANGREPGQDPYYRHLYRVSMDGGAPELLTPENANHDFKRLYGLVTMLDAPPGSKSVSERKILCRYLLDDERSANRHFARIVRQVHRQRLQSGHIRFQQIGTGAARARRRKGSGR